MFNKLINALDEVSDFELFTIMLTSIIIFIAIFVGLVLITPWILISILILSLVFIIFTGLHAIIRNWPKE